MTTISRYLEAEVIDPALPRDSFVPPDEEDDDDFDAGDLPGPFDGEYDNDE